MKKAIFFTAPYKHIPHGNDISKWSRCSKYTIAAKSSNGAYKIIKHNIFLVNYAGTNANHCIIDNIAVRCYKNICASNIRRCNYLHQIDHESIGLIYYTDSKFSFISQLTDLEELIIYDKDIIVLNLFKNKKLKKLTIVAPDLKELNTLRNHQNIEFIDIYETSITDYSFLSSCHKLKKLVPSHITQVSSSFPIGVRILTYNKPDYWIE